MASRAVRTRRAWMSGLTAAMTALMPWILALLVCLPAPATAALPTTAIKCDVFMNAFCDGNEPFPRTPESGKYRLSNCTDDHLTRLRDCDDHDRLDAVSELYISNSLVTYTGVDFDFQPHSFGNQITKLPGQFLQKLENLHVIDVSYNSIDSIDDAAFDGSNAKIIILRHNRIETLGDDTLKGCQATKLDLTYNRISSVSMGTFDHNNIQENLDVLVLSQNRITFLESTCSGKATTSSSLFDSLTMLSELYLNENRINMSRAQTSCVFKALTNLHTLDLRQNRFTDIHPFAFHGLSQLGSLDLSSNNVSLPTSSSSAFQSLTYLYELLIADNNIDSLTNNSFNGLRQLRRLDLSSNGITLVSSDTFQTLPQLQELDLSHNKMDSLDSSSFSPLTSLRTLDLSSNSISTIDELAFDGLNQLESLGLKGNRLTLFHAAAFRNLTKLKTFLLGRNPIQGIRNRQPNKPGELGVVVDLSDTKLTDPDDFNHMNFLGPLFVLPDIPVKCDANRDGATDVLVTSCKCAHNHVKRGKKCVDISGQMLAGGIVGGLVAGAVTALLFLFVVTRYRRQRAQLRSDLELREQLLDEKEKDRLALKSAWKIDYDELQLDKRLDAGTFGEVWQGTWGGIDVAAKVLKASMMMMDEESLSDFDREVDFLMRCRHVNVVRFFGAGRRGDVPFLVMEFMAGGSLSSLLLDHSKQLTWIQRLRFACDIARGLSYIHSLGQLHRDVKSANVLLDSDQRCKVTDFGTVKQIVHGDSTNYVASFSGQRHGSSSSTGVEGSAATSVGQQRKRGPWQAFDGFKRRLRGSSSRSLLSTSDTLDRDMEGEENVDISGADLVPMAVFAVDPTLTAARGTPLYMAPEVIRGKGYTFSADVFSFAIVLWEIAARRVPDLLAQMNIKPGQGPMLVQLLAAVEKGERLPLDDSWPEAYRLLIERCWATDSTKRPTMRIALTELEEIRDV